MNRQSRLDLNEPAELAIYKAIEEVEKLGADVRLTDVVTLLSQAKQQVGDFIDEGLKNVDNRNIEAREGKEKVRMVVGFMFDKKETAVLLIEKNKPAWMAGKLNGIGGKCLPHENYGRTMCREFQEETGISWGDWNYVMSFSYDDTEVRVFTAKTDDVFDYKQGEDEKVCLIPINELDKYDHMPSIKWLVPMCLDDTRHLEHHTVQQGF